MRCDARHGENRQGRGEGGERKERKQTLVNNRQRGYIPRPWQHVFNVTVEKREKGEMLPHGITGVRAVGDVVRC